VSSGSSGDRVTAEDRYKICPQLEAYDQLLPTLAPYVTFLSPRRHRSPVVNTDENGFRLSSAQDGWIDSTTWPAGRPGGIVVGSSMVFGVGATSDGETLASHLNGMLPQSFLNLGIRAGNSTQELIAAVPFLERAECIIVCSGINNLLLNLQSLGLNELFGPFFEEGSYEELRGRTIAEVANLAAGRAGGLGGRRLALEGLRRFTGRLTAGRRHAAAQGDGPLTPDECERRLTRALELQRRDLRILARARRPASGLLFAAQPFAPVCHTNLSPEEQALFEMTEHLGGPGAEIVTTTMTMLWPRYVAAMRQVCSEEGVAFADVADVELKGWSFVDRVHMTDAGYRQVAAFLASQVPSCSS